MAIAPDQGSVPTSQPPTAAPSPTVQSAGAAIDTALDALGLSGLGDWAWQEHLKGVPDDQILLDLRQTPQYKAQYPEMDTLRAQGVGWNEGAYNQFVKTAQDTLSYYGIPKGIFDDRTSLAKLMVGGTSTAEFDARIKEAAAETYNYSPEAKAELKRMYGVDDGGIVAFALDPAKALPVLQQQFAAARIAGISDTTGFGQLSKDEATALAQQGVTDAQAQQGLSKLAHDNPLFTALPGEQANQISQQVALGAEFGGNAADQNAIEQRRQSRTAAFQGGTQFATNQGGVSGLSSNQD